MEKLNAGKFIQALGAKKKMNPLSGQLELTYRCQLRCAHCYCVGLGNAARELSTSEWKRIIDDIRSAGCLFITFSGGDPFIRHDFLELYRYAKTQGFLVSIFSNAIALTPRIIKFLEKSPPVSMEISLNGLSKETYEAVSGIPGSFAIAIRTIRALAKTNLRVILKVMCLQQNKHEVVKIKHWVGAKFGTAAQKRYRFKCASLVFPRLDRDQFPLRSRLSTDELEKVFCQDPELSKEHQEMLAADFPDLSRKPSFMYHCTSWRENFFVDPYGRLKFCGLSSRYTVDLRTASFAHGFYHVFPRIAQQRFKTDSKCRACKLRPVCFYCPARAYLETGNDEGPVPYYCELAQNMAARMAKTPPKRVGVEHSVRES